MPRQHGNGNHGGGERNGGGGGGGGGDPKPSAVTTTTTTTSATPKPTPDPPSIGSKVTASKISSSDNLLGGKISAATEGSTDDSSSKSVASTAGQGSDDGSNNNNSGNGDSNTDNENSGDEGGGGGNDSTPPVGGTVSSAVAPQDPSGVAFASITNSPSASLSPPPDPAAAGSSPSPAASPDTSSTPPPPSALSAAAAAGPSPAENIGDGGKGAIVGGVFGALACIAILAALFWFVRKRRRLGDRESDEKPNRASRFSHNFSLRRLTFQRNRKTSPQKSNSSIPTHPALMSNTTPLYSAASSYHDNPAMLHDEKDVHRPVAPAAATISHARSFSSSSGISQKMSYSYEGADGGGGDGGGHRGDPSMFRRASMMHENTYGLTPPPNVVHRDFLRDSYGSADDKETEISLNFEDLAAQRGLLPESEFPEFFTPGSTPKSPTILDS